MSRMPYDTDLTDAKWAAMEPLLPKPKSGTPRGGRPAADTREILNAVWYLLRSGTAWRLLPHDFPPWQTVHTRFRLWRLGGVWGAVHARLRGDVGVAAGAAGATPTPETLRVDSQTVKTAHGGPRGYGGGKKVSGRKRFAAVDSLGLIWSLVVTAARVQDRDIGSWLLGGLRWRLVWAREVVADAGFSKRVVEWVERWCGWAVVTTREAEPPAS